VRKVNQSGHIHGKVDGKNDKKKFVISMQSIKYDVSHSLSIPAKMYFQTLLRLYKLMVYKNTIVRTKFKQQVSIWQCKLVGREVG